MAWQTPKTDWTAADGVRNTDFNRIEGNILELYNTHQLRNTVTIYVSTTGNDSTGTGTSSAPYRTINKALSAVPKNIGDNAITINIAAGTYQESVVIAGFNGLVTLTGAYGATVTINSLTVDASMVRIFTISLRVVATGVTITNGATLMCSSSLTINDSPTGILVNRGSVCIVDAALSISGSTTACIHATNCSRFYVLQLTASDSTVIAQAEQGSSIAYSSTNLSVTVITFVTRTGGRIYSGGQVNVPL